MLLPCISLSDHKGLHQYIPTALRFFQNGLIRVLQLSSSPMNNISIPIISFPALNSPCSFLLLFGGFPDVLRNHRNKISAADPYLWMCQFFSESQCSEDIESRNFWNNVVSAAIERMTSTSLHANPVNKANSYLRARYGMDVAIPQVICIYIYIYNLSRPTQIKHLLKSPPSHHPLRHLFERPPSRRYRKHFSNSSPTSL